MSTCEYFGNWCKQVFTLITTLKGHEANPLACPKCGGKDLESQMATFFAKTSRKSSRLARCLSGTRRSRRRDRRATPPQAVLSRFWMFARTVWPWPFPSLADG